jgi:acylaminoacyl-peptidase
VISLLAVAPTEAEAKPRFTAERVFDLEYADNPQISPDGSKIVYQRHSMDKQSDRNRSDLWILDLASGSHRPLITGGAGAASPAWSPDGTRLLYSTSNDESPELRLIYMDDGTSLSLAQFTQSPRQATWSPNGKAIAFTMLVPEETPSLAKAPTKPKGAEWAPPVRVFDEFVFRFDGQGYLTRGTDHVFVLSADGGSPRQLTSGGADFSNPAWLDADSLLVVGNDDPDRDLDPIESEIYRVDLKDLSRTALTDRDGPDGNPVVSPDGLWIAYTGYDDEVLSYQQTDLYVMAADGSKRRLLTKDFDRSIGTVRWRGDSKALLTQVQDTGDIKIVAFDLNGGADTLQTGLGGTTFGRPYAGASFSVSSASQPVIAYTINSVDRPADIALRDAAGATKTLTDLNGDLLPYLEMAPVEEMTVPSSYDGRDIQAWVALPPGFKKDGSYPMILEIHGGPFTMYGPFFAAEIQRYAAEGYVTVWVNPRGSTGYGEEFAQLIDQNYPGEDYDDLMTVVDTLIKRQYVDQNRLFVTGGSGGGVLTSWIVGKTERFAGAATVKPVINWLSMALSADIGIFVQRHWIRVAPWDNPDAYWKFSPLSLVGNVTTPTLVMVGEEDWRTPTWEAEQYYFALKARKIDTALVRVPGSPHYIAGRPSRLIAKTDNIMGWFARYDRGKRQP